MDNSCNGIGFKPAVKNAQKVHVGSSHSRHSAGKPSDGPSVHPSNGKKPAEALNMIRMTS